MRSYRGLIVAGAVLIGGAVLAIAVGAVWLNSFIHSPAFKAEVESRASQSVGGPVQVEAIDFDVFHGIKLKGLVTQIDPAHAGGQGALKASIAQVNCTYSLVDLLGGKLRLTGVVLDKPQITLTKQPTEPLTSAPAPSPDNTTPASAETATGGNGKAMPFQFVLDRAKVNNGSVTVVDAAGASVVALQGVNVEANTAGYSDGRDITGSVKIGQVTASGVQLTDFSTPVTYHANFLAAKPFSASAFKGRIAGDFLMDGSGPSVLDVNANGLDVEQLAAAASTRSSAHVTGHLDVQSKWRGAETGVIDGEGDAQLTDGKLENVRILREASQLLRVKELDSPVISKAQTHFVVRDRQTRFIGLVLQSPLFKITGDGTVGFDGGINASLVLALSRDAMGRLPREAAASFVQQSDGTGSIAFNVTGTTADPQTDLPERLLMQNTQIKNVLNKALNKFFH